MRIAAPVLTIVVVTGFVVRAADESPPRSGASPSIDDLISLKRAGSPVISPDGRQVAYTIRETNWDDDRYETEIWIADVATGASHQLTNAARSSSAPAWSPDGSQLVFSSDRSERRQLYLINPSGGEAERLTSGEEAAGSFKWAPDGRTIAYSMSDPIADVMKTREKTYGQFEVSARNIG
jgi:Tol biopolymer transport system component